LIETIKYKTPTIRSILQIICKAHLEKSHTTRILMIYKGRHIFSPPTMPGTLSDCGGLNKG
jgi:hypothetical protein